MCDLLIGKILTGIKISKEKKALVFELSNGETVMALCDADCCSETWIEHIELPALGFPAKILEAANLELNKAPLTDGDFEYLQFYGFKISTDKGDIIIDYRNESNGFYGGDLTWPGEYHYGGVYGQNDCNDDEVFIYVNEDF